MEIVKIVSTVYETPNIKTIRFRYDCYVNAGQFFMVWLPGVDEIPMSVSYTDALKGITVEKVGSATAFLHSLKKNDRIGIRGPYGNGFQIDKHQKIILAVGGGTGMACLAPAVEHAIKVNKKVTVIIGARTSADLLFVKRLKSKQKYGCKVYVATDDGTTGFRGQAPELALQILEKNIFDLIITCGPELMLKKILNLGIEYDIEVQASLERYMKCGIGICDSCAIDGFHVCKDGPVFSTRILKKLDDFAIRRRNEAGTVEKII
jgi:dihydroorotate dehydrogenase electron transfer subunit